MNFIPALPRLCGKVGTFYKFIVWESFLFGQADYKCYFIEAKDSSKSPKVELYTQ